MHELEGLTRKDIQSIADRIYGDMVKGVVDVAKGKVVIDAELHSDIEAYLLSQGSQQGDLWGINIYPSIEGEDMVEFDSLINIRPGQGNRSRGVENIEIQRKIIDIIFSKIV